MICVALVYAVSRILGDQKDKVDRELETNEDRKETSEQVPGQEDVLSDQNNEEEEQHEQSLTEIPI